MRFLFLSNLPGPGKILPDLRIVLLGGVTLLLSFWPPVGRWARHLGLLVGGLVATLDMMSGVSSPPLALKVLPDVFADDPERLARFQREAKVLASLNHLNIASIYDLEGVDRVQICQ